MPVNRYAREWMGIEPTRSRAYDSSTALKAAGPTRRPVTPTGDGTGYDNRVLWASGGGDQSVPEDVTDHHKNVSTPITIARIVMPSSIDPIPQ